MGKAFVKRMVGKHYLAIVWGHVGKSEPCLNGPDCRVECIGSHVYKVQMSIGIVSHKWPCGREQKIVVPESFPLCQSPRESCTLVVVLEHAYLCGQPASRLLLIPQTGRRHQLRVHCAIGLRHPIVGDLIYSQWPFISTSSYSSHLSQDVRLSSIDHCLDRMMLHAYRLNIVVRSRRKQVTAHHLLRMDDDEDARFPRHKTLDIVTDEPVFFRDQSVWKVEITLHELSAWKNVYCLPG
ncbi:unnamed protein product [Calicophoron daubneyi]